MKEKTKRETNDFIFKYQKQDTNKKLVAILGDNFKKYRDDFEKTQNYLQTKFIPDFPLSIVLGTINRCNLNCRMCYKKYHTELKTELPVKINKKIIDECKKNKISSMVLGLDGEPLLDANIKKTIAMMGAAKIQDIFFSTNGILLNDKIIKLIIKNKISRLRISLDAATKETYKKIRGFDMLGKVEGNIQKIIDCKKKYKSPLPTIRLSFVVMDQNKKETGAFIAKWKDRVDDIDFQRLSDFSHVDSIAPLDLEKRGVIKDSFCSYPFYSLSIWADGAVSPCCSFYGRKLVFGNIYKESLKDIWNGKKMKEIREQIASKKFNPICQNCLYFRDQDLIEDIFKK